MPLLDYRLYRQVGNEGGVYRFTGGIESITDGHTLWVRGEDLTMPVSLEKTQCWLLPIQEGEGVPEAPEQIRWNRVSTITEGAKVFIGGRISPRDDRLNFASTKESPLMVIFYNCPETALTDGIIRAARTRNEYWNNLTSISLIIGALALVYIAASFLNRPAFRLTVITALIAVFTPILPIFPPGLLLTVLYRRMTWVARKFRAYRDLARLPLRYLQPGQESGMLSTGEKYGFIKAASLPPEAAQGEIPFLIPEHSKEAKKNNLYIFGVINENSGLPQRSKDPFVNFGILPAHPENLARQYSVKAYTLESLAWIVLLLGICLNIVFIYLILFLLRGVYF